ncbi:hypothetical protein GDO81_016625 [Engystomops pustulosus]|uniref:Uncharacterized protein n=1 Tax=Engystomops pustulosus TaxID=76066 RepID=A0AAV7ABB7_ENGPU|nr:hypothetical protein GDO81_016625 [Engystomops pustulosus]
MGLLISPISFCFLGTLLLAAPHPGASWYKHSASPRYHTVGRASGLLIGVRRSPYLWRRDAREDPWPVIQQGAERDVGLLQTPLAGEQLQLSLDPGEKKLLKNLIQKKLLRSLEEERSLNEVQDGKSLEQGSWQDNDLGEDKGKEDQSQMTRYSGEEGRRSLEESMWSTMEPGDGKRSPEETWITQEPEEIVRSLDEVQRKARIQDGRMRNSKERGSSGEDLLSMFLHLQEENRSHPQPWRTLTAKDKQSLYYKSEMSEWVSCEDFRLVSNKVLCRGRLRPLSRSQPRPRRPLHEEEDPTANL